MECPMITKSQAENLGHGNTVHYGRCSCYIGPRGSVTLNVTAYRVNGKCKTWKTRPDEFRLPLKRGLYEYADMTNYTADSFHLPADCPLNDPTHSTVDYSVHRARYANSTFVRGPHGDWIVEVKYDGGQWKARELDSCGRFVRVLYA